MAPQLILFFHHLYQLLLIEGTLNKVAILIFYVVGRRIGIESVCNHENLFSVIFVETPLKCVPVCTESDLCFLGMDLKYLLYCNSKILCSFDLLMSFGA